MKLRYSLVTFFALLIVGKHAMAQLVGDQIFLQGRFLEVGVAPNGSWGNTMPVPATYHTHTGASASPGWYVDPITGVGAAGNGIDFSYDVGHDGWGVGSPVVASNCCFYGAFFLPGTPFVGWSIQMNGVRSDAFYTSGGVGGFAMGTGATLSGTNVGYAYTAGSSCGPYLESTAAGYWAGTYTAGGGTLSIRTVNRVDTNASWDLVNVTFKNTGSTPITGLYYMVTGDPDNDQVSTGGSFPTNNHISYQNDAQHRVEVNARPPSIHQDAFSGLAAKDCRAKALIYQLWPPALSAANTLDLMYAGTATGIGTSWYSLYATTLSQDIAYGLVFKLGTLAPGDSTRISYAWIFSDTAAIDSAFPQPQLIANCVAVPNVATVSPCPSTTIPVNIAHGEWGTTNWTWSPAVGLASTTGITNSVNISALPGPTTYTITGTDTLSCNHFQFLLTVLNCYGAFSNSPGDPGPTICVSDTLKLFGTDVDSAVATYFWRGPGISGPVVGAGLRVKKYPLSMSDTGWYYLIKNIGGFLDTQRTHVMLRPLPIINATSNAPICSGNTLNLYSNPDSVGETWSWRGPLGFLSTMSDPTRPGTITAHSGVYWVRATFKGCTDSASVNVVIDSTPVAPVPTSNSPICSGNTLLLGATDATAGVSYMWTGPGGFVSGLQNPSIIGATTAAGGIYTVTAKLGVCTSQATIVVTINPTPVVPTLGSNTPCSGNALNLTASSTPGSTFVWTGPNSFTSALQNPTINPATTLASGVYTVVATLGPCSSTGHLTVTVDSTPAPPVATNNSPICSGDTLKLFASTTTSGAVTYTWGGPSLFTSTQKNPMIPGAPITAAGTYTVLAKLGSCISSGTTNVVIKPTPSLPVLATNAPICSGNLLSLTATTLAGSTYHWSGPNGFSATVQNPTINPAWTPATGIYSVYATLNGCTSPTATIFAAVDSTPVIPTASSNSPGPPGPVICAGDTLKLYSSSLTPGVSFSWTGPNLFSSTLQNPIIPNVTTAATGLYQVTGTLGACSTSAIISVTITPTPPLTATSNTPICSGDTVKLFAVAPAGAVYTWTGPYTFFSNAQNPQRTPALTEFSGVYTVSALFNGCTTTIFDTVKVNRTPDAPGLPWLAYCQFQAVPPLQALGDLGSTIIWYPDSKPGTVGSTIPPVPPTARDTVMWFFATQTVNNCKSVIDSMKVTVNPTDTFTSLSPGARLCPHDTATMVASGSSPSVGFHWYPSMYLSDSMGAAVTTRPVTDVTYTVVLTNVYGCTDTGEVKVTVRPGGVIYMPDSATIFPGESYQISPQTNCVSMTWFPPAGLSSPFVVNPVASPAFNTKYVVTGVTSEGCILKDSINIYVSLESLLAVPNAFIPGSSANGLFKVLKRGEAVLNHFRIYDRWGVVVFETKDIDKGWDGKYKDVPQPVGVYVYDIEAVTNTGAVFKKTGNVTLLR